MQTRIMLILCSFLFGFGLEISGMTNPQKVQGFLNLFRHWDPSLIFVMIGAILVNSLTFFLIVKKMKRPWITTKFFLPTSHDISKELVIGSAIFGIGWGLGGFCPGPAISSLYRSQIEPLIVVVAMLVGMKIYDIYENLTTQ